MIRAFSRLLRPRLALMNAVSAMGGYLLYPAEVESGGLWAAALGVLLLAAGASAVNQVQERDLDRLMTRTRLRPLPRGELTAAVATAIGAGAILAGLLLLGRAGGAPPVILCIAALACYLVLYTPLKRRTPFALAIGAVCGALPPVIGWSVAGGDFLDYRIMLLAGLLYLWQIPHFWLFQRRHSDDYRRAGFPLLVALSKESSLSGLFGLWIAALTSATMLLPAFGIIDRYTAIWYVLFPLPLMFMSLFRYESALFTYLNLFPVMVTTLLLAQRLLL